jgi:hypothetical protein
VSVSTAYRLFSQIDAPVADVPDDDLVRPAKLGAERRTAGDPDAGAHDAVATDEPALEVGHVHRTATTAVRATGSTEQLGHQGRGRDAHREGVVVTAVCARGQVTGPQRRGDTDGDRLLTEREVDAARDLAAQRERVAAGLEFTDQDHVAEPAQGFVGGDAVEVHRAGLAGERVCRPGLRGLCPGVFRIDRALTALTRRDAVRAAALVGRARGGGRRRFCRGRRRCRGCGRRDRCRCDRRRRDVAVGLDLAGLQDDGQRHPDRDQIARCETMPPEDAVDRSLELRVRLVGLDLGDRVARRHGITWLLRPCDEQRLRHRKSDRRDRDLSHRVLHSHRGCEMVSDTPS